MSAIGRASQARKDEAGIVLPKLGRRNTALAIVLLIVLLVLAWYGGGEQPIRPIEQDVAVPEGAL